MAVAVGAEAVVAATGEAVDPLVGVAAIQADADIQPAVMGERGGRVLGAERDLAELAAYRELRFVDDALGGLPVVFVGVV